MNMKQKWKRFWTLKSKANAGFTLVELIVVIAILGILAGVGTLGYSGYIKKAERVADEQLLSAINTAFASACMANGESNYNRTDIEANHAEINDDGAFVYTGPFADTFSDFYEVGEFEFKVIENVIYDAVFGGFKDPAAANTLTLTYGGAQITITAAQIQALKDSSFYGEGMTSAGLLQQVDNVSVIANGMGTIQNIMSTPEFTAFALDALGLEAGANLSNEAHKLALKKLGWSEEDYQDKLNNQYGAYEAAMNQVLGNALVLYTAQQTTTLGDSAKNLLDDITSEKISQNMYGGTAAQQQTGVNQAALAYGMYYAYVNSDACTDSTIKGNSNIAPNDVITALDSNAEFQNYMKSTQGEKDMEAYLEALSVINSGAQTSSAVEQLLTNGFVDLNDLLTGTMGK